MLKRATSRRRLSTPVGRMKPHYTVVVAGSGYGGSIAASRLARAGQSVCLLERGREILPGQYPDTEAQAASEMQLDFPVHRLGPSTGLFDFRTNDDINVLIGCGLGGTSLINANVVLQAEDRVFEDTAWPPELRTPGVLDPYYARARDMLKPETYPVGTPGYPLPRKTRAHQVSAEALGEKFELTPIHVNFTHFPDGRNHVGVEQQPCVNCGDCVSGCNYAAKNTLLMNYLPDAHNHGAEIFTRVSVRWIDRQESSGRWIVYFNLLDAGREKFSAPPLFVTADFVILAAGTLGTTEILMRSADQGLSLSERLGERFTGNGDVLGFAYNSDEPINGIGWGESDPDPDHPVGPCITSVIDARNKAGLDDGAVIEEGTIPGALNDLLPAAFAAADSLVGEDTDRGVADWFRERFRTLRSLVSGLFGASSPEGAARRTQTFLVMGHDGSDGRMRLQDNRLRIDWKGVGEKPVIGDLNEKLFRASKGLGGAYVKNPLWADLLNRGRDLVTVHPLGGCSMAEDSHRGVVNHKGQVFSSKTGTTVHPGLYVADGSLIPRSLGVNPLLTIAALAERNCETLAKDQGWAIDWSDLRPPHPPGREKPVGFRLTETMVGHISNQVDQQAPAHELAPYRIAEARGKKEGSHLEFTLTIEGEDLDDFVENPRHEADLAGTVQCPLLSANPLTVTRGRFNLFVADPSRVETREMRYAMQMISVEGKTYYFYGFKRIRDDRGIDVWTDTTRLHVSIHDGEDDQAPLLARGILTIGVSDFSRQLTTVKITRAEEPTEAAAGLARFGGFFAGSLFESFGKELADDYLFDPDALPRRRRPLRSGQPEVYSFQASDGVTLRLSRYRGGDKGPVILSHGLGVSSLIFAIDTIETNLLEYLWERDYDVWLLDYRVSIDLNSSQRPYHGDHVARLDYPAAVGKVREVTGRESVQMTAHCFGATTLTMALLSGLEGVRSVVLSQVCTDVKTGALTRIKSGLFLAEVLEMLGVDSMTAYADKHRNWFDALYDQALKFYPIEAEERARSPVHRRITFLYGTLYELDQLNEATFKALHEMFGVANIAALEHLAVMVRKGKVVDAGGEDVYLGNIDRWKTPTAIIHGAENACYLPECTLRAFERLTAANPPENFTRHVIPRYGHIDCIFGKNASRDVYPLIAQHLDKTALD